MNFDNKKLHRNYFPRSICFCFRVFYHSKLYWKPWIQDTPNNYCFSASLCFDHLGDKVSAYNQFFFLRFLDLSKDFLILKIPTNPRVATQNFSLTIEELTEGEKKESDINLQVRSDNQIVLCVR